MSLADLAAYLIACLGVTYAWTDTEVSVPLRNLVARIPYLRRPLLCHECSSFWISLFLSFFFSPFGDLQVPYSGNLLSAFCGFFANLLFVRNRWVAYKD